MTDLPDRHTRSANGCGARSARAAPSSARPTRPALPDATRLCSRCLKEACLRHFSRGCPKRRDRPPPRPPRGQSARRAIRAPRGTPRAAQMKRIDALLRLSARPRASAPPVPFPSRTGQPLDSTAHSDLPLSIPKLRGSAFKPTPRWRWDVQPLPVHRIVVADSGLE